MKILPRKHSWMKRNASCWKR